MIALIPVVYYATARKIALKSERLNTRYVKSIFQLNSFFNILSFCVVMRFSPSGPIAFSSGVSKNLGTGTFSLSFKLAIAKAMLRIIAGKKLIEKSLSVVISSNNNELLIIPAHINN